jgi:hypothetical protein
MINIKQIPIEQRSDFSNIKPLLSDLKSFGKIDELLKQLEAHVEIFPLITYLESRYVDSEFTSTYSSFHSKKHKSLQKETYRLHFFDENSGEYYGFIVIRPSFVNNKGRAYLSPKLFNRKGFMISTEFEANIIGENHKILAFPWMSQETDISVCAHVSLWQVIKYLSTKYHYQFRTINDIVELTPTHKKRAIPSSGINLIQMSSVLNHVGLNPVLLQRTDNKNFDGSLFAYIESGLPVICANETKGHAFVAIGHGELDNDKLASSNERFLFSWDLIDKIIVSDDNYLPYKELQTNSDDFTQINFLLVPNYYKMYLAADIVIEKVRLLIESNEFYASKDDKIIARIYMTSSRSLKKYFSSFRDESNSDKFLSEFADLVVKLDMPKFIWCVDISTIEEFASKLTSQKVIIDATAGTQEEDLWILKQKKDSVIYFDQESGESQIEELSIPAYPIYINNLKEF